MGGYGAFKFAFHQPQMFGVAASMSGAFDVSAFLENKENKWAELNPSVVRAFEKKSGEGLEQEDLFWLAENFPKEERKNLPYFYFDCGIQDSLFPINKRFSQTLKENGIKHQFEGFAGGHDWDYWDMRIKSILKIISKFF